MISRSWTMNCTAGCYWDQLTAVISLALWLFCSRNWCPQNAQPLMAPHLCFKTCQKWWFGTFVLFMFIPYIHWEFQHPVADELIVFQRGSTTQPPGVNFLRSGEAPPHQGPTAARSVLQRCVRPDAVCFDLGTLTPTASQ